MVSKVIMGTLYSGSKGELQAPQGDNDSRVEDEEFWDRFYTEYKQVNGERNWLNRDCFFGVSNHI